MTKANTGAARPAAAILSAIISLASVPASAADQSRLTVVELFQSQGCSDCPPANANVMALSSRPDLLTLSFGVTYWDQLGWKDTFASPQYTDRQWAYARAFHRSEVFTPEVVVNGRADVVGSNRSELEALIRRESGAVGPSAVIHDNIVTVSGSGPAHAQVWLVRYNPNIVQVPIARGENGGRTLPHKNVVKELVELGEWSGQPQRFAIPDAVQAGLREAVLVQDGPGGAILAAARE
ncbi:MAG TPA: DUF1223 domain-containing protein [Rhizomicrobium sp.]|jgi:hypothetical protein|nr:DUF1223 domain-containing protein [Rhizomicrobium sp.]